MSIKSYNQFKEIKTKVKNFTEEFRIEILELLNGIKKISSIKKNNFLNKMLYLVPFLILLFFSTFGIIFLQNNLRDSFKSNEQGVSASAYNSNRYPNYGDEGSYNRQNENRHLENTGSNNSLIAFLETYNQVVFLLAPILDNYISSTPNPINPENGVSDRIAVISADTFYQKTFQFSLTIMVFLVIIRAFSYLFSESNNNYYFFRSLVYKTITTTILLIGGLSFMSLTIELCNGLNQYLMSNGTLSKFMTDFSTSMIESLEDSNSFFSTSIFGIFEFATFDFFNFLKALPLTLPLIMILVFLVFISIQFILRFINIYFLIPLQPLASVFNMYDKTSTMNTNFWKTWFTVLIQQPAFILGFGIVNTMIYTSLSNDPNLSEIIIFLSALIFLSSLNLLVSRIFGDMWVASSTFLQSSIGAGIGAGLTKMLISNGQKVAADGGKITKDKIFNDILELPSKISMPEDNSTDGRNKEKKRTKNSSVSSSKDQISEYEVGLRSMGFDVNKELKDEKLSIGRQKGTGTLLVKGTFYGIEDDKNSDFLQIYTDYNSALRDNPENSAKIREIKSESLNLIDTSNSKDILSYNKETLPIALDNDYVASEVNLRKNSSEAVVRNNLSSKKSYNNINNIDGVIMRENNSDKENNFKFLVYKSKIEG